MTAAIVVALVVALGGWVLAGAIAWLDYRTKTEEIFLRALDWLSGGTQKRNLGIAAIEGSWERNRVRRLSTPLLCNSSIYLLLRSESRDSPSELNNLYRMMELLTNVRKVPRAQYFHYRLPLDSLEEKKAQPEVYRGLHVPGGHIEVWRSRLARQGVVRDDA